MSMMSGSISAETRVLESKAAGADEDGVYTCQ